MRFVATIIFLIVNVMVAGMLNELGIPMLVSVILTLLLAFASVLVHELGHAVAAHRLGPVVQSVVVLVFRYHVPTEKLTLHTPRGRGDVGGYVTYTFVDRWWTSRKEALVAAAGPAANLVLAIAAGLLAPLVSTKSGASLPSALMILSGGMAIANLLPFAGSDGSVILRFLRTQMPRRR